MRPLLSRIDELTPCAPVACVDLVLLRIVVVQAAQRLRLHPKPFLSVKAVVCGANAQVYRDCNLLQVMQKQLPHVQAPQQAP